MNKHDPEQGCVWLMVIALSAVIVMVWGTR